ncbi:MAG TPA: energy transducer TonB [Rhizomicrobium sp.]|nr:energy transducer TonB [Rhizomicrobium sp.]
MKLKLVKFASALCLGIFGANSAAANEIAPDCSYPGAERIAGIEGTVTLAITVATDGSVRDAQVTQSSGNVELDRVAEVCVKAKWRYKPAMKDGVPVEAKTQARVVWKLPQ